jgi:hypothetical protein
MKSKILFVLVLCSMFAFTNVNAQNQESFENIQKLLNETDGMFRNVTFGGSNWYMKNQSFSMDKVEVLATINGKTCYDSYTNIDWKSLSAFEFDGQDNKNLLAADLHFKKKK